MQLCYLLGALENTVVVMDVTTVSGFMRMKYLFFFFFQISPNHMNEKE